MVRFNRAFAILAITVILSVLAVAVLSTPALAAPIISLSPASGTVGTQVEITGENFSSYAGDTVHIYFGNTEVDGSPITIPGNGEFTLSFPVPDSAMPGTALVTVKDETGNQLGGSAAFVVPQPSLTLDKGGGVVGTTVTVDGAGFLASEDVTLIYTNGTTAVLGSTKAGSIGEFTFSFDIPESTGKGHKIIAEDAAGNRAEATFSVIPYVTIEPAAGAIGDSVVASGTGFGNKSRISVDFDQGQVVTDNADANGSFEFSFNVPDMELRAYTVTVSDAAGNSATVAFTINAGEASFVFPEWGIYGLMGLGGLLLFILGIWIGRKYAYSY